MLRSTTLEPKANSVLTTETAESDAAMSDTNVLKVLFSMKHELRVMKAQGSGNVVNISSTMGQRGMANMSLAGFDHQSLRCRGRPAFTSTLLGSRAQGRFETSAATKEAMLGAKRRVMSMSSQPFINLVRHTGSIWKSN
jgi:NAD(P)-dependent dehydrogenase (short-subunit alcohol dehydrogenase family)